MKCLQLFLSALCIAELHHCAVINVQRAEVLHALHVNATVVQHTLHVAAQAH